MGLTAKEKRAATKVTAPRYQKAKKNQKGIILEEFAAFTGYNRCYAAYLLRIQGKKRYIDSRAVDSHARHVSAPLQRLPLDMLTVNKLLSLVEVLPHIGDLGSGR